VLSGSGYVGPVAHPIRSRQLAVLGPGDRITVGAQPTQESTRTTAIDVLLLGGQPIREPVFHYGPFVMNSRAELIEALQDYQSGKFGNIPPNALMPHRGGGTLQ
jgi:redox-sensitive bicupin YhaK (pirin superfamily)